MKDAYKQALAEGKSKAEAYAAAKEAYADNHTDTNPRPTPDVPSDRSMTREQWDSAYRAERGQGTENYQSDFADLARYRRTQGMPTAGSPNDRGTAAKLTVDQRNDYYGQNAARTKAEVKTVFDQVNSITPTHAEGDVFYQSRADVGNANEAVLVVDRYPCNSCGYSGGIRSLARQMGVTNLTVVTPVHAPIIFNPQIKPIPNPF